MLEAFYWTVGASGEEPAAEPTETPAAEPPMADVEITDPILAETPEGQGSVAELLNDAIEGEPEQVATTEDAIIEAELAEEVPEVILAEGEELVIEEAIEGEAAETLEVPLELEEGEAAVEGEVPEGTEIVEEAPAAETPVSEEIDVNAPIDAEIVPTEVDSEITTEENVPVIEEGATEPEIIAEPTTEVVEEAVEEVVGDVEATEMVDVALDTEEAAAPEVEATESAEVADVALDTEEAVAPLIEADTTTLEEIIPNAQESAPEAELVEIAADMGALENLPIEDEELAATTEMTEGSATIIDNELEVAEAAIAGEE